MIKIIEKNENDLKINNAHNNDIKENEFIVVEEEEEKEELESKHNSNVHETRQEHQSIRETSYKQDKEERFKHKEKTHNLNNNENTKINQNSN